MLNIYLIYVSSLETGDVNISKKIYTSFGKSLDDIDTTVQKYIKERKLEKLSIILSKDDFSEKGLRTENQPIEVYFQRK